MKTAASYGKALIHIVGFTLMGGAIIIAAQFIAWVSGNGMVIINNVANALNQ